MRQTIPSRVRAGRARELEEAARQRRLFPELYQPMPAKCRKGYRVLDQL